MTATQVTDPDGSCYDQPTGLFVGGEFVVPKHKATLEVTNPYTQETICEVSRGMPADIDNAVNAAAKAFRGWSRTPSEERGELLYKLSELVLRDAVVLSKIEAIDGGKPVHVAINADVRAAAACLKYYAGWAGKQTANTVETDPGTLNMTIREPLGVCGLIIPWNFPLLILAWKLGPCLASGNTAVIKPAEITPLSALYLARLVQEAGFPPGTVNVVPGHGSDAGAALASHQRVNKVSFTGSTLVGRSIQRASADSNLKKTGLELGGKSPSIVFEGADLERAVESISGGVFYNMGQNCAASSRVYVQESIYEEFLSKLVARASKNVIGDPFDSNTTMGPQISAAHHAKILSMISQAKEAGGRCILGGRSGPGWSVEPTIFRDVAQSEALMREEVFGPVAAVASFETAEEALAKANDSCYGLAAAVFTRDIELGLSMAKDLEAGSVWLNGYNAISHQLPFGGYKESGNGKDLGREALDEFTQTKQIRVMLG